MEMNKAMELLRGLVSEIERQTCEHAETHRGGAIWEICDSCGAKWADDEGGKPEFEWPESVEKAREFLAAHPTVEQAGGDEREAAIAKFAETCPMTAESAAGGNSYDIELRRYYLLGWDDRTALAQPSPAPADEKPGDSILCSGCFAKGVGPEHFDEAGKCLVRQQTEPLGAERARVVVVLEPVTMDGTTTIREYVANAVPKDTPMDKWTQGYEECKRRIHAMFEQPCNKRINGKTVSEGLLRRPARPADRYDEVFTLDRHEAAEELRALLSEQEGGRQ
ncbi:TPA: hypothetical protein ACUT60_002781 [Pseudomonas aeruginosa]